MYRRFNNGQNISVQDMPDAIELINSTMNTDEDAVDSIIHIKDRGVLPGTIPFSIRNQLLSAISNGTVFNTRPNLPKIELLQYTNPTSMILPSILKTEPILPPGNIVSVVLRNGLGNRIFQILTGLGYAEKYNKVFIISRSLMSSGIKPHEQGLEPAIIKLFPNIQIIDTIQGYITLREKHEMNYSTLDWFISNVVLQGYFQDERYFPSSSLIPDIRTAYYENTYFVHIRAGDYLDPGSFGLDLVSYHRACFSLLDSVRYLVFSNDNAYADTYMKQFGIEYTISETTDPLEALIEMANCAGGICANSTFSWLGAFFQRDKRGKVFMPSVWLNGRDCNGIYPTWATIINLDGKLPEPPVMKLDILPELCAETRVCVKKDKYELSDISIINIPSGRRLNYNACIVGNRIFFRTVQNSGDDQIYTCILDNFNCVPNTMRCVNVVSTYNNVHVEDPRVILHKGNWFVCYTDGYKVGIAKLDINCNTIYSHYLYKPDTIKFEGGDGREKNWIPTSVGENIHIWYSDNPRTLLVYEDTGYKLEYKRFIKTNQRIISKFGSIRGGCPPIPYDENTMIWFFHTFYQDKYRIGAYLTRGLDVISITPSPILSGNHIVFPCGAIQHNNDFYISMGIQDSQTGILKISRGLTFIPI